MSLDSGRAPSAAPVAAEIYIRNPKRLPVLLADSNNVAFKTASNINSYLSYTGAFTNLAYGGAAAAVAVAGTFVTVCNVAGGGFLTAVISSCHTLAHTPIIRITVDGTVYTITPGAAIPANYRLMLGGVLRGMPNVVATATLGSHFRGSGAYADTGFEVARVGGVDSVSGVITLPTPTQVLCDGAPCVRFDTSLLVEVTSSGLTATDPYKYAAALYTLDL